MRVDVKLDRRRALGWKRRCSSSLERASGGFNDLSSSERRIYYQLLWATGGLNSFVERWWINLGGGRPPGIRVGRRGTAPAPSVHAPTVRASPRLIHLSVGLIVQLLLGARTNHVHPLVPATPG